MVELNGVQVEFTKFSATWTTPIFRLTHTSASSNLKPGEIQVIFSVLVEGICTMVNKSTESIWKWTLQNDLHDIFRFWSKAGRDQSQGQHWLCYQKRTMGAGVGRCAARSGSTEHNNVEWFLHIYFLPNSSEGNWFLSYESWSGFLAVQETQHFNCSSCFRGDPSTSFLTWSCHVVWWCP